MHDLQGWLRRTELDRISALEFAAQIVTAEHAGLHPKPRHYPGYPTTSLPKPSVRWRPSLDAALRCRRCCNQLVSTFPLVATLGRLLQGAHGITGEAFRGPTPSAGGLQALELYLVHWQDAWLPRGVYHYDRVQHALSQVAPTADEHNWRQYLPSLHQVAGGALLWLLIGDARSVRQKYGERSERFLLLEAGHLMQNLCLMSSSLGLHTVPLGGCLEGAVARELRLPPDDLVLYAGVCGGAKL